MFCAQLQRKRNSQATENNEKWGPPNQAGFFRRENMMGKSTLFGIIALVVAIVFIAGGLVLLRAYWKMRDRQYEEQKNRRDSID